MAFNLTEPKLLLTELALNSEGVNYLPDYSRCSSNPDVLMAHWTVLIQDEPILNATLAEKLITIVALFCIACKL